ncbi:MAG: hypothetical protein IJE22_08365 [Oscillibacter sp.]|nr:hypothetical protein [Oscillibacter sp.]
MSKKKEYVPPMAEMILLSPCEALAAEDWAFGRAWKNESDWGKFSASGFAFGGSNFDDVGNDGSFFTKPTGTN